MKSLILFLVLSTLLACTKKNDHGHEAIIEVSDLASEIKVPKQIMQELDADFAKDGKGQPVYLFVPIQVKLLEFSSGVLEGNKGAETYSFPKGGGRIDLAEKIVGSGSFFISFPEEQFSTLPDLQHLYYVSNSPVVKIDGESFGLGCGKYVDLKGSFSKLQKNDFLKLNTSAQRYLHVSAGQYIFVFRNGAQIYLTQLTITDSRYEDKLCVRVENDAT